MPAKLAMFSKRFAVLPLLAFCLACPLALAADAKPNIIIILSDDV